MILTLKQKKIAEIHQLLVAIDELGGNLTMTITCKTMASGTIACTIKNPSLPDLEIKTSSTGGRITSLKLGRTEIADHHPIKKPEREKTLATPRKDVGWDQVGLGGGRTWVAPQSAFGSGQVPYLALDLGEYRTKPNNNSVLLTSGRCPETKLIVLRSISAPDGPQAKFKVASRVLNKGNSRREMAPWEILQTKVPAAIFISGLKNKPAAFSDFSDPMQKPGFAEQTPEGRWKLAMTEGLPMFKLGFQFNNNRGKIVAFYPDANGGYIALTVSFNSKTGKYPHKGPAEIFFNPGGQYIEIEVLGRTENIRPNRSSSRLIVNYSLRRANEIK